MVRRLSADHHAQRWVQKMMKDLVATMFTVVFVCACGRRQEPLGRAPFRDEVSPPAGCFRSGAVWTNVPANIASAVRSTAESKGYDLREYWDPEVEQKSGKWSFFFQGTMPDPGFSFIVTFDTTTGKAEIEPGA